MKKIIISALLLLALLLPAAAHAYDFEVDGIYYNIIGNEATVMCGPESGDVIIPETVTHKGIIYPVTSIRTLAFGDCSGL